MSDPSCDALCELKILTSGLKAIYYTKLVNLSAFAILIYDFLLTFATEKELIWNWTVFGLGKVLFLTESIRYFTLTVMIFIITVMFTPDLTRENQTLKPICSLGLVDKMCLSWTKFHWFAGVTIVMLTEVTLQVRIYAMYGKSRTILAFLIFTFLATFGTILMFIGRLVGRTGAEFTRPIPGSSLFICVPSHVPHYFRDVWVPLFVHEIILLGLALNKGVRSFLAHQKSGYVSRLTTVLVRDSVLYYISVFGVFFSLEIVWAIGGVNYIELPFGLAVVIGSIMSQRLLLKIRRPFGNDSDLDSGDSEGMDKKLRIRGTRHVMEGESDDIMLATLRSI